LPLLGPKAPFAHFSLSLSLSLARPTPPPFRPIFALGNTAIPLLGGAASGAAVATAASGPTCGPAVALGIFAGLVLGKPLGIVALSWVAVRLGLATYPKGLDLRHLAVVGTLGGIGFTM